MPETGTAPLPTRERIVETALRLFSERGTSAVSMRELAEDADVTVPGLYYHFASKSDLIREVYRARFGPNADNGPDREINGQPLIAAGTVESVIVEQARREFARLVADREFLRFMQRESVLGDADALEVGASLAIAWRTRWVAVLASATDIAPGVDLQIAADGIATFLWGIFVEYLNREENRIEHRIGDFARLLAAGLTRPDR